jgi:hypothetical protein
VCAAKGFARVEDNRGRNIDGAERREKVQEQNEYVHKQRDQKQVRALLLPLSCFLGRSSAIE